MVTDPPPSLLFIDGDYHDRDYYVGRLRLCLPDSAIFEAATGKIGLQLYDRKPVDCVILEIDLPDMSGFEVLVQLVPVARCPEVTVVVLTRLQYAPLLELTLMSGAQAALRKSLTPGDLLHKTVLKAIAVVHRERNNQGRFAEGSPPLRRTG